MKCFVFFVMSVLSCIAYATSLTVIYDSGDTLPIADYTPGKPEQISSEKRGLGRATLIEYPIVTSNMASGKVEHQEHSIPHLQTPLFIVGNDEFSKQWLVSRLGELKALGAVGMLVEVKSSEEVKEIRSLAQGISIFPASGDDIAKELNLTHYPVLISKQAIEQ